MIIELAAHGARCQLYRYGAHLVSWVPAGAAHNMLWVSPLSDHLTNTGESLPDRFVPTRPIRGGVPIAWPQFADVGSLPQHGFARQSEWQLEHVAGGRALLSLEDSPASQAIWPHRFRLEYEVALTGPDTIQLELRVSNPAESGDLSFTGCLHSYIAVDATGTTVQGLAGKSYVDKCDQMKLKSSDRIKSSVKEMADQSGAEAGKPGFVDRVYEAADQVMLETASGRVLVSQQGWPNTTVYNPWRGDKLGGAAAGLDFSEDGYQQMLCIEPTIGRADQPVVVPPGGSWSGSQTIQVLDLNIELKDSRACCLSIC